MVNWVVMTGWRKVRDSEKGFTIVELLIVIVVIAILAAITIVSYAGIQQRTKSTAIIDAASKSVRMVQAYTATKGSYPYTTNTTFACITTDSTCRRNGSAMSPVAAFTDAMEEIGSLPKSVPTVTDIRSGITYQYDPSRMVDGVSSPAIVSYYIPGVNSDCGMAVLSTEGTPASTSSLRYTTGNVGSSGVTQCVVRVDGPGV